MQNLLAANHAPTLYGCLCVVVVACALFMPKGLTAMDRLLARQPEQFQPDDLPKVHQAINAMQPVLWPRVVTAVGCALLFAALLTLMFLCQQLAL